MEIYEVNTFHAMMGLKLISKYNSEFLIDVIRLEFKKGLFRTQSNIGDWTFLRK